MIVLGIETSCDDSAAGVYCSRRKVLASLRAVQAEHHQYGGVVPELASRVHLKNLPPIAAAALREAGLGPGDLDAVAATQGPGLLGSLLVGWHFARALALAWDLPCLGVHHIEGHILANHLEADLRCPALVLVVSGGHSQIILMREPGVYELLATTRDDAAGEAFDKVAKLLGLGFPGGPAIEARARRGDPKAIAFPRMRLGDGGLDFSFSGLKTAARLRWEAGPPREAAALDDFCASFQRAVVEQLLERLERAARGRDLAALCLAGGVAANGCLRDGAGALASALGLPLYAPAPRYCTDNGAMIACAGALRLAAGSPPPGSPGPEPFSRGVICSWR